MTKRQRLARECLRQLWQIFDAGGISMGRSQQSVLLEAAMKLIGPDTSFSTLADHDIQAFMQLVRDEVHRVRQAENAREDKRRGLRPLKVNESI
jgi:hypothetical protein